MRCQLAIANAILLTAVLSARAAPSTQPAIRITEDDAAVQIETDALSARINKKGYVSGIAAGSFVDKKTGAKDLGFGLHIMDFLMAPGWRDDGYERDPKIHGNLPKHYVEGPQLCTQAKQLPIEIIRGDDFAAIRMHYTYTRPGEGFKAGSRWMQTIVFRPGLRYVLSSEQITSANDVDDLFYRLDMPGHIRHKGADDFTQVYLSYLDKPIPAEAFDSEFEPDAKYLYQRKDDAIPTRMIRGYQVKRASRAPGPWLVGMTLDPSEVAEAWCHQRGYVCFIEELHRRHVRAGETFGAAYVIGWFDSIDEMNQVYDRDRGATSIDISNGKVTLKPSAATTRPSR